MYPEKLETGERDETTIFQAWGRTNHSERRGSRKGRKRQIP